jgi:hypothetical protein
MQAILSGQPAILGMEWQVRLSLLLLIPIDCTALRITR